jgi:hypothetical protein
MSDCPICLFQIDTSNIRTTICSHEFHRDCLEQWFTVKSSCPLCRTEQPTMTIIEHKYYNIIYNNNYNNIIDDYITIF